MPTFQVPDSSTALGWGSIGATVIAAVVALAPIRVPRPLLLSVGSLAMATTVFYAFAFAIGAPLKRWGFADALAWLVTLGPAIIGAIAFWCWLGREMARNDAREKFRVRVESIAENIRRLRGEVLSSVEVIHEQRRVDIKALLTPKITADATAIYTHAHEDLLAVGYSLTGWPGSPPSSLPRQD